LTASDSPLLYTTRLSLVPSPLVHRVPSGHSWHSSSGNFGSGSII